MKEKFERDLRMLQDGGIDIISMKIPTVNISFVNNRDSDETQFELTQGTILEMAGELCSLWAEFCRDNKISTNSYEGINDIADIV